MGRHNESFQQDYERSVKLGESNLECIRAMQRWCEHIQITPRSSGLFAQMSGLPSGSHHLACPHSSKETESANLRWITSSFLIEACDGCPHHSPTGDASWGTDTISKHKEAEQERKEQSDRRQAEIDRLRAEMISKTKDIGKESNPESLRIVSYFEDIFSDDYTVRSAAIETLKQAAKVGSELFPKEAIDLLAGLSLDEEYGSASLGICSELVKRTDIVDLLRDTAIRAIREGQHPHEAAVIAARLGDSIAYPLDAICIERLLLTQHHDIPIGGWSEKPPDYSASTLLLAKCYDANDNSVLHPSQKHLQSDNEYARKQVASALKGLQEHRPSLVKSLFPDLMQALEQYEDYDMTYGNASGRIVHVFQAAFRNDPATVDAFLADHFVRLRPTVQEDIVKVYRDQFFNRELDWRERRSRENTYKVSDAERTAIKRLLEWIKNDGLEPEIRQNAADALSIACDYATGEMVKEFDALLGYYALLCEQEEPPPAAPSILLPGNSAEDRRLAQMNQMNRRQHWGFFKHKIVDCLEELCKSRPHDVFESVHACLAQSSSQLGDDLRASVVTLLGELGSHFDLKQRALPLLMRELMHYGSAWVRAKALDALVTMFYAPPPSNVVDVIIVHLQDSKVVVHQAAVKAVARRPSWFSLKQSYESLCALSAHVRAYRNDPYQLENACEAVLALSGRHAELKELAIAIVEAVYPTGELHVDEKIADKLTRVISPNSNLAPRVAVHVANFLATHDRDRYNSYSFSDRDKMVRWLHELPPESIAKVSETILEHAMALAARDFWESWQFASLFGRIGLHKEENGVLNAIHKSYPQEPKFNDIRVTVQALARMSEANHLLSSGEGEKAADVFRGIRLWGNA